VNPRSRAVKAAQKLLDSLGENRLPVRIDEIAKKYAILQIEDISDEISGILVPRPAESGRKWIIVVNKNHSIERRRFSMAHELGHLVLHEYKTPHADGVKKVRFRDADSSLGTDRDEIEANQFAAELLMPAKLLIPRLQQLGLGTWDDTAVKTSSSAVQKLAADFRVSEQALVLRIGNLLHTDERY